MATAPYYVFTRNIEFQYEQQHGEVEMLVQVDYNNWNPVGNYCEQHLQKLLQVIPIDPGANRFIGVFVNQDIR